ncbi:glycosyltransferase family 4 protein [[Clostridium] dakarense]|uniref:glycosyltransferase family 4 protein n=1 Tax=Faecalimicrobium dakarense TaxID=1301100 RepID=UPI0004B1CEB3|nr:glycosyltransferase family 4 protein [[Clostridium] dakarense]
MSNYKIIQVSAISSTMNGLLRRLNEMSFDCGYNVIGVCSKDNKENKYNKSFIKMHNIEIERRISLISNIRSIYNMYKLFKKEKPDIVHVHTPIASVLGRIAAKLAKVPNIIYTAHGFYFHENMRPVKYNIFLNIEKIIAKFCTDFIFTQSEEDRNTALQNKFIEPDNIITIGNGIDTVNKFNPSKINLNEIESLYKELNIQKNTRVISFIGRLVREKGIVDLLEAYTKLDCKDTKLIIIGDLAQGERDKDTVKLIENYKNNKCIEFIGNREDINNLLYISDIFCLPSYREGMPRSIIEAMAMECAVIATDIRGCREEVVDEITGYLVKINSPNEIEVRIKKILNDENLLNTMKLEGRKRAEKLYNEDKVVRKQLDIFERLLNDKANKYVGGSNL